MVDDLEVATEGRVLVGQGVEAVGAGGDDLLDPGLLQGLDVHPGLLLVEVLVAQPADRVAGAALLGPEDAEGDPGPVEHAGGGLGPLAGPLVEGAGAAHPVEVLDVVGDGPGDHRHLEVERLRSSRSAWPTPRPQGSPWFSMLRSISPASVGNFGLHQHLVAAHVDDGVDVLDVDRALLDARPAGGAGPQHVGIDDRGDQVLHLDAGRPVLGHDPVGRREQVVPQVHDEQLGGEGLAGVPGRALGLAPAALGAGGHVEELLPREVLDAAGAEDHLVLVADVLHGHVRRGGQGAQGPGAPGGGHVDGGQEDVEVLRVGHEDQEAGDDGDVGQQGHRLDDAVHPLARAASGRWPVRGRRTPTSRRGSCPC